METECIRCKERFRNSPHPLAHFFVVCPECRKKEPENSDDQFNYNIKKRNEW